MPCGLVSEVHSAFLWAVELQSLYCRRTPSATEQLLGFFFGSRKISLQILRFVGRVWNEGSRMLCQRLPSPSTTTRRLVLQISLCGAACIDQASSYLEGAEQAPL